MGYVLHTVEALSILFIISSLVGAQGLDRFMKYLEKVRIWLEADKLQRPKPIRKELNEIDESVDKYFVSMMKVESVEEALEETGMASIAVLFLVVINSILLIIIHTIMIVIHLLRINKHQVKNDIQIIYKSFLILVSLVYGPILLMISLLIQLISWTVATFKKRLIIGFIALASFVITELAIYDVF